MISRLFSTVLAAAFLIGFTDTAQSTFPTWERGPANERDKGILASACKINVPDDARFDVIRLSYYDVYRFLDQCRDGKYPGNGKICDAVVLRKSDGECIASPPLAGVFIIMDESNDMERVRADLPPALRIPKRFMRLGPWSLVNTPSGEAVIVESPSRFRILPLE
jgi:hypothetical protein